MNVNVFKEELTVAVKKLRQQLSSKTKSIAAALMANLTMGLMIPAEYFW